MIDWIMKKLDLVVDFINGDDVDENGNVRPDRGGCYGGPTKGMVFRAIAAFVIALNVAIVGLVGLVVWLEPIIGGWIGLIVVNLVIAFMGLVVMTGCKLNGDFQ